MYQEISSRQLHIIPEPASFRSEALTYLRQYQQERDVPAHQAAGRERIVRREIAESGFYRQTFDELAYGAKLAWRNSNRCIGRLYWKTLKVFDCRHLVSAEQIFDALLAHLDYATNGGNIRSTITIFAPERPGFPSARIWNSQIIRYAGYRLADGTILGDPANVALTNVALELGWRPKRMGRFDVLPLIIQAAGEEPRLFEIPSELVLEVPMSHPTIDMRSLGLRWHAVPMIANMRLEIGGISYPAAPFNGWYMGTEIGARNFGDEQRYDQLRPMARVMGLDTESNASLWRDRAIVELNVAVLHSFAKHNAKIIDHHTASDYFLMHRQQEADKGRVTTADWDWIVPPISGSACPVFHHKYPDTIVKPNFFAMPDPY